MRRKARPAAPSIDKRDVWAHILGLMKGTSSSDAAPGRGRPLDEIETWIFDLDNTLYPASCRLFEQVQARMNRYICERFSLSAEECSAAVQYVDASGAVYAGHHAVAALLHDCGGPWRLLAWPLRRQVLDPLWNAVYRWVADHRSSLPGGTPACAVPRRDDAA